MKNSNNFFTVWKQVLLGFIGTSFLAMIIAGCAALLMPKSPEQAYRYYMAGAALLKEGNTDEALRNLRLATQLDSLKPEYFWKLGQAYMGLNWLSYIDVKDRFLSDSGISAKNLYKVSSKEILTDAVGSLKKAAALQPQAKYLLEMGEMLNSTGDDSSALNVFRQALTADPGAKLANFKIASIYYFKGQYDSVLAHYREELKLNPDAMNLAPHLIASAFEKVKSLDSAEVYFKRAVNNYAANKVPYENLGGFFERYKRYDDAISTFQQMVGKNIDTVTTVLGLNKIGDLFLGKTLESIAQNTGMNFINQAVDEYKKAIKFDSFNAEARRKLDIMTRMEKDVKNLPEKGKSLYQQGEMLFAVRNYQDAIRAYTQALETAPSHTASYLRLGDAFYFNNEPSRAVSEYKKAVALDSANVATWGYLANVYYNMKNYGQAVQAARKALEIEPRYKQAQAIIDRIRDEVKSEK